MFTLGTTTRNPFPDPPMDSLPPARTTPDLIADALRAGIARGDPPPGAPLRQEALAARFGVSRLPVRDALRRLEAEGLVVVHPNRGAYVVRFNAAEVQEIYDLRRLLEGDLLTRAVPRMGARDLGEIEAALLVAERGADGPRWSELDESFHAALYGPAARPRQLGMVSGLRGAVRRYQAGHAALPERTAAWLRDHRTIFAACRAGDAAAARRALDDHLDRAGRLVLARLS